MPIDPYAALNAMLRAEASRFTPPARRPEQAEPEPAARPEAPAARPAEAAAKE
ncbi:hypothetical protein ACFWBH_25675 [Streptomyces sp. NPDC059999]|uniref:hypothetical protein n=1 Tax=unclassified Streptomyces TaxID=2593676 RepID=UPI002E35A202|nr:hypothetical protein [Streptomyces sp. NBC_01426]